MPEEIAVIISIENYRDQKIKKVKYAKEDALAFKLLLENEFNLETSNIHMFLDNEATKNIIEYEIPYIIRNLNKDDKFYFYYVGHGFSYNGNNYLSVWDTSSFNLTGTSFSFQNSILKNVGQSECKKNLFFIDACATETISLIDSREIICEMNSVEFKNFVKDRDFTAVFLSCSEGEKSYASDKIKHGVWTWYLLNALKGNDKSILFNKKFITDNSLKNYLAYSVPKYITKNMAIKSSQTPQAFITSSTTFIIREIIEQPIVTNPSFPKMQLKYTEAYLNCVEVNDFNQLPNFNKKVHFVPEKYSTDSTVFVQRMIKDQISDEITAVYNNCKSVLKLKRSEINKDITSEGGGIDTEYFRYSIYGMQSEDYPEKYNIIRTLILRMSIDDIPKEIENLFENDFNQIIIPMDGKINYDNLVSSFEVFEDLEGGKLSENDFTGKISYKMSLGSEIFIDTKNRQFIIRPKEVKGIIKTIEYARDEMEKITGQKILYLGTNNQLDI